MQTTLWTDGVWSRLTGNVISVGLALFTILTLAVPVSGQGPDRSGFTMILDVGIGLQKDAAFPESEVGIGGINLGLGGFVNENTAVLFRASGTTVDYGGVTQTSGVGGPAVQYWVDERLAIEGGIGLGFWDVSGTDDTGLGVILAASYALWNRGSHNLFIGAEYAPAFTDPETVHNFGIVFGWQLL
jgi:hypothetical protein